MVWFSQVALQGRQLLSSKSVVEVSKSKLLETGVFGTIIPLKSSAMCQKISHTGPVLHFVIQSWPICCFCAWRNPVRSGSGMPTDIDISVLVSKS